MVGHNNIGDGIGMGLFSNGYLATVSNDLSRKEISVIKIWDPVKGTEVKSISTQTKSATSHLVLANGHVAVGFHTGQIRVLDVTHQGSELFVMKKCHATRVLRLLQLPNGQLVSSGSKSDPTIKFWDLNTKELVRQIATGHKHDIWEMCLSKDAKLLASSSADHTIKLWTLS